MNIPKWILPVIVLTQLCCTSLWFASNAVITDLMVNFGLESSALSHLTSAVQFGFISGTLSFALLNIADRYPPARVFFCSALSAALFNVLAILEGNGLVSLLLLRFMTGFFLAGIYPVGMKIAADYYEKGLGKSLGYLVGAVVMGTAFPHFVSGFDDALPWRMVFVITTGLSLFGGLMMVLLVPDGPFRKPSQKLELTALFTVFRNRNFRGAAFGYFGHMWELYAFWAFVPVMLSTYNALNPGINLSVSTLSFLIIGGGGVACVIGGYISQRIGSRNTGGTALFLSGVCCLVSPLFFMTASATVFGSFLFFWGLVVVADSPQFSTLVAQHAAPETKGTALTIVNCIGFSITIFSIQLMNMLNQMFDSQYLYIVLAVGPALGLWALLGKQSYHQMRDL